jgi:hypothetical protein
MLQKGHGPERLFEPRRLGKEGNAIILEPEVIGLPGSALADDFVTAHHGFRRKQPQQTKLCDPAIEEPGGIIERFKPPLRRAMMYVSFIRQGEPHIDVREKE